MEPGIYRVFNVTSNGTHLTYQVIARFQITPEGKPIVLDDRAGYLGRNAPRIDRFLPSFINGSHRHTIMEQPGAVYQDSYIMPL